MTVDQGILHQQNLGSRKLAIISIKSRTNQLDDLLPLVDAILKKMETISAGGVATVS